ncbi:MAG: hypothetical protein U1E02_28535, partial [Hydrogenophaga sp.]|nr:hypothetical protein [Hydrogenophaga sp.]
MNRSSTDPDQLPLVRDELDVLGERVPLDGQRIIELGCRNARLARALSLPLLPLLAVSMGIAAKRSNRGAGIV